MSDSTSTKIHINLPEGFPFGGESLWADHVEGNLYSVQNVPFFAYDVSLKDVVECNDDREFIRVHKRSEFCTLRLMLPDNLSVEVRREYISRLKDEGVESVEFGLDVLLTLNVPTTHYQNVCVVLEGMREDGAILSWEQGSIPAS